MGDRWIPATRPDLPKSGAGQVWSRALRPIPYKEVDLNAPEESFDLKHELTDKDIERFVAYNSTLKSAA